MVDTQADTSHSVRNMRSASNLCTSARITSKPAAPKRISAAPELNPGTSGQNFRALRPISGALKQNSRSPGQMLGHSDKTPVLFV